MVLIRLASHGKEVDCDKEGRRGGGGGSKKRCVWVDCFIELVWKDLMKLKSCHALPTAPDLGKHHQRESRLPLQTQALTAMVPAALRVKKKMRRRRMQLTTQMMSHTMNHQSQ